MLFALKNRYPRQFDGYISHDIVWDNTSYGFRAFACLLNTDKWDFFLFKYQKWKLIFYHLTLIIYSAVYKLPITLQNKRMSQCESQCVATLGCTHYQWSVDDKSCVLKFGPVQQLDAVVEEQNFGVHHTCGIVTTAQSIKLNSPTGYYLKKIKLSLFIESFFSILMHAYKIERPFSPHINLLV